MPEEKNTAPINDETLINDVEAAKVLGVAPATMRKWRCQGKPPVFLKIGRLIKYRTGDLYAHRESCKKTSTSQEG